LLNKKKYLDIISVRAIVKLKFYMGAGRGYEGGERGHLHWFMKPNPFSSAKFYNLFGRIK